jgi:hypothetical protein
MLRFTLLFAALSASAFATSYDLYDLVQGGGQTITIGDKQFHFLSANLNGSGVFTPTALAHGEFTVDTEIIGNLYGFSITGSMTATATSPTPQDSSVDLGLVYYVTTVDPLMTDLHAALNGGCAVTGTGTGTCSIIMTETATDASLNSLINPSTLTTTLASGPTQANFIQPTNFVRVTKDLLVAADTTSDSTTVKATVSVIDQFISQTPEPGFYGVLACGLSTLFFFGRRRKKA